jgi:hypothetical protein
MKQAHERFGPRRGCVDSLVVTDQDLNEYLRGFALKAMEQGSTTQEMEATLRCLVGHCDRFRKGLKKRTPRDTA